MEGKGGYKVKVGNQKGEEMQTQMHGHGKEHIHTCIHFLMRLGIENPHLHLYAFSPVRKMEADISGQFFVRNMHLHEEKRVKILICKAI